MFNGLSQSNSGLCVVWLQGWSKKLCQVEEHQHQLAHQCSPNIIGIWKWGICGLMGGAFITFNGWSIYFSLVPLML